MKLLCVALFLSGNRKAVFPTAVTFHDPCGGYESICYLRRISSHTQEEYVVADLRIAVVHSKFYGDNERRLRPISGQS